MNIKGIGFRALVHGTESEYAVRNALLFVSGGDKIEYQKIAGHFQNEIIILKSELSEKRNINDFLSCLRAAGLLDILLAEADQRTDDGCVFHFRLGKQDAYLERLSLAKTEDVIDCSIKVLAYPAKRENAVLTIVDIFKSIIDELA